MNLTQATVGRPTDTCRHLIVLCIFSHCDCQENKKSSVERLWIVIEEGGVLSPWLSRSSELAVIWLVARTVCVMTRGVKISWFYKGGLLVSCLFLLSLSSDEAHREQRERRQKMAQMISSGIECAVTPKLTGSSTAHWNSWQICHAEFEIIAGWRGCDLIRCCLIIRPLFAVFLHLT